MAFKTTLLSFLRSSQETKVVHLKFNFKTLQTFWLILHNKIDQGCQIKSLNLMKCNTPFVNPERDDICVLQEGVVLHQIK